MQTDLTENTTLVAVADVLTAEIGDETVALQTSAETYYGIEGIGTRVWELLQEPRTVAELQAAIAREYDVDRRRCRRDLDAFLAELVEKQLVERLPDDERA